MHVNTLNIPTIIMNKFKSIIEQLEKIDTLKQIASLLSWDQETYMPSQSISARATQLETLSGLIHDHWQSETLKNNLSQFIDIQSGDISTALNQSESAFIREFATTWRRHTQLSKSLVQELTKATSTAQHIWADARKNDDFNLFAPHLKHVIDLTHEKINQLGYENHPYNALIDEFEPGMTVQSLDAILMPLKNETITFIKNNPVTKSPELNGPFSYENQLTYSKELMVAMGYDTERGRLDISTHPFTIDIHPNDVRITTRINPDYLMESISSTIHEVGHGLYEQGLDPKYALTPYGASRSMGIHESQSRLWEIFIGQSLPFWEGQLNRIHNLFPTTKNHTALDFHQQCRQVTPHWCRVESDIVTYNLHIIIRYECEKALFSNDLSVNDLPDFWNQKMKDYLGLSISSNAKGCLQDVHWSAGLFGYFPSYTLGTLIAAQLYKKLDQEFKSLEAMIQAADFIPIKSWLNENIHFHGSKKTTELLLQDLGVGYDPHAFISSLSN